MAEDYRSGFEAALANNPYDQDTRLIFADWLEEKGFDDEALVHRAWTVEKQQAEDWLRGFAAQYPGITYEQLLEAGKNADDQDRLWFPGNSGQPLIYVTSTFWNHWETVTKQERPDVYDGCFNCYNDDE